MNLDKRRLGEKSPTAKFSPAEEITLCDSTCGGQMIARVKITGRIRDHSIQVTELESYDRVLYPGKITRVGLEWRYTRELPDRTKVFRKVHILQGPEVA